MRRKNKTVKIPIILSIAISIAVILIILYFTVDQNTIETLKVTELNYEFLVLAVILNFTNWIFWGARLKVIACEIDKDIELGYLESLKIVITNMFLASITPSMAGGEPVRIYLLNKKGMSFGSASASVISERLTDAIFVLILVPISFFIFSKLAAKNAADIGYLNIALLIGVFVFVTFFIIFLYAIAKPEKTKKFLLWVNNKFSRFYKNKDTHLKTVEKINREVDNFHSGIILFKGKGRKSLLKAGIFTAISWSAGFMIPSMLLMFLGLPPYFIESYAAQTLLLVIIMMPTMPGSSGVAEGGATVLYGVIIGFSQSLLGVFILLHRMITFYMNFIFGAIFQYSVFKSVASFSMDKIKKYEKKEEIDDIEK